MKALNLQVMSRYFISSDHHSLNMGIQALFSICPFFSVTFYTSTCFSFEGVNIIVVIQHIYLSFLRIAHIFICIFILVCMLLAYFVFADRKYSLFKHSTSSSSRLCHYCGYYQQLDFTEMLWVLSCIINQIQILWKNYISKLLT